jgi:hypothetical protein
LWRLRIRGISQLRSWRPPLSILQRSAGFTTTVTGGPFVVIATLAIALWAFRWPTTTQDEFGLLIYPDLVTRGWVPNRDFFTPYGPGTFWPLSLAFLVSGGPSIIALRVVGLAYHVLVALGVRAVLRPRGDLVATAGGCIAATLSAGLLLVPYGWFLALSALLWSMALVDRGRLLWGGILCGLACTVRPEFIVAVLLANVPRIRSIPSGIRLAVGMTLGAVPLVVHASLAGPELLNNIFVDRIGVDARLKVPIDSVLQVAAMTLLAIAASILMWQALWQRTSKTISQAGMAIGILPQAVQRTDREHLLFVAIAVIPFAFAYIVPRLAVGGNKARPRLVLLVPSLLTVIGLSFAFVAPHGRLVVINGRSIYVADHSVEVGFRSTLGRIEYELDSGEKVFVGAEDMSRPVVTANYFYYFLPSRVPHAYYLEFAPGVTERRGSRLLDDVRRSEVLLLSRPPRNQRSILYPHLPAGSNNVDRYVDRHFCRLAHLPGYGVFPTVNMYRECDGPG